MLPSRSSRTIPLEFWYYRVQFKASGDCFLTFGCRCSTNMHITVIIINLVLFYQFEYTNCIKEREILKVFHVRLKISFKYNCPRFLTLSVKVKNYMWILFVCSTFYILTHVNILDRAWNGNTYIYDTWHRMFGVVNSITRSFTGILKIKTLSCSIWGKMFAEYLKILFYFKCI